MTDSSIEAVARAIDPEAWQAFDEQANRRSWNAFERAEAMIAGKRLAKSLDAACRVLAALPSPEREPMREALEGYRAAVSFISADSWDGCHDCIDILRAARSVDIDWDWAGNPDRIAAELKSLRRRAGMNGAPPDAALAPPTAQSGDRT